MKDDNKTKRQLINELSELRKLLTKRSENKTLQKGLVEFEKLSALGRLTANVAHEIRNPITIIGGLAERLKKSILLKTKEKEYVELISLEAKRLEEILREVLVFSNKPFFSKERHDINKIVNESLEIYADTFTDYSINVQKIFSDVTQIYVDERHVKEALKNVISNAIEAMPNGGTLTVATNEETSHGKNYVAVKITDTGVGISEDKKLMIFEPFFSTKVTKKETGLGLPITKKIVEGHGGFITLKSSIGKGSTISLYFPYRAK